MQPPLTGNPVSALSRPVPSREVLRRAGVGDFVALSELEAACFEPERRDTPACIRRSLRTPRHETWVIDGEGGTIIAALFLRPARLTLRVFSLATDPGSQGKGLGTSLLNFARERAVAGRFLHLSLEADAKSPELLAWYERHGFVRHRLLPDFYAEGHSAWRMISPVSSLSVP